MKNLYTILLYLGSFLVLAFLLFGIQWFLQQKDILDLNFKIHFLIFFVTAISLITIFIVFALGKKNVIGFVFLGFVVFKFFAMGYIAVFQKDFKTHLIPYFVVYWLYLLIEVVFVLKLIKKQD